MASGDLLAACTELRESEYLDPQVGTALNLAYCYERMGRTATAWATWLRAAAAAAAKGQGERQEVAIERANLLQARLLHATVTVSQQNARDRIQLTIDSAPLPRTDWGLPIPLDPGPHRIAATADGFRAWTHDFMLADGVEPTLVVPELQSNAVIAPPGGSGTAWRTALWATGTTAAVTLGVGAGFGIASLINRDASNSGERCSSAGCDATGHAERVRANTDGLVADILFATAGTAVVGGAITYVFLRRSPKAAVAGGAGSGPGAGWSAYVGPTPKGGGGVFVAVRW